MGTFFFPSLDQFALERRETQRVFHHLTRRTSLNCFSNNQLSIGKTLDNEAIQGICANLRFLHSVTRSKFRLIVGPVFFALINEAALKNVGSFRLIGTRCSWWRLVITTHTLRCDWKWFSEEMRKKSVRISGMRGIVEGLTLYGDGKP